MTTFNAGAIEANLTLGRSSWTRDLRKTKKEIADLEKTIITVMLDLDADNALIQMSNFEALAEDLDNETYTPKIDVDAAQAQAQLAEIASVVQALDMTEADIDLNVDVDGYGTTIAQLATLEAQIGILDGREIDIDVDVDRAALRGLLGSAGGDGSGGHMGLLRILLIAIIALLPVLAIGFSVLGAAIIGFAGALTAALGPLVLLGAGLAGLVARYKEVEEAGGPMGEAMQAFADSIEAVQDAWNGFLDDIAPAGFELMADALELVADILPTLAPLFNVTAEAIGGVLDSIREWVEGPEYEEMIGFFSGFGVDMLVQFMNILGDLIQFFGRLFDAMEPFIRVMMDGLEEVTQGWADWADELENNEAFQTWIDNTLEYGPRVLDMLGSMIDAFYNIGQALLPFAGPMLTGLTAFFDFIANMDTSTLTIIVGLFTAWYLGSVVLVPIITALVGGIGALLGILTAITLPMVLVAGLIAGLAATIWHLWETNETFRNAVIDTWNNIRDTMLPIIMEIWEVIKANWGPIKDWAMEIWGNIQATVVDAMIIIRQIVKFVMHVVREIWREHGDDIIRIAKWAFGIIGDIIGGAFRFIRGIFQFFSGLLTGDTDKMWSGIKNMFWGAVRAIGAILRILGDIIVAIFDWIRGRWNAFIDYLGGLGTRVGNAVSGMWDGLKNSFKDALNAIIGWWNNFNLSVNIPDKIPGLPDSFTIETPNIPYLAKGAYITDPVMAMIGEGSDNEIVAPEPILREIVRENSGSDVDYDRLAAAFAAALATIMGNRENITREDLLEAIAAAGMKIDIDASGNPSDVVRRIIGGLSFELRRMGFGGKRFA